MAVWIEVASIGELRHGVVSGRHLAVGIVGVLDCRGQERTILVDRRIGRMIGKYFGR